MREDDDRRRAARGKRAEQFHGALVMQAHLLTQPLEERSVHAIFLVAVGFQVRGGHAEHGGLAFEAAELARRPVFGDRRRAREQHVAPRQKELVSPVADGDDVHRGERLTHGSHDAGPVALHELAVDHGLHHVRARRGALLREPASAIRRVARRAVVVQHLDLRLLRGEKRDVRSLAPRVAHHADDVEHRRAHDVVARANLHQTLQLLHGQVVHRALVRVEQLRLGERPERNRRARFRLRPVPKNLARLQRLREARVQRVDRLAPVRGDFFFFVTRDGEGGHLAHERAGFIFGGSAVGGSRRRRPRLVARRESGLRLERHLVVRVRREERDDVVAALAPAGGFLPRIHPRFAPGFAPGG
mmetsp:Transcript_10933/g.45926  ORF Transcript_10933/g.45926 Transcript_10933/m.45926 type:complete len:359 (-) Transcript_10933:690-1766(-)